MDNSTIGSVDSQARPVEKRMMRRHLILLPLPLFVHAIFPYFFYTSTSGFYSPIPHPHLKHFPASLQLPGFIHLFHIPIFRFTSTSAFYSSTFSFPGFIASTSTFQVSFRPVMNNLDLNCCVKSKMVY